MHVSVVIPTLDEADRIDETVRSALGPGVDVIVVDGGSTDGTPERAAAAGARVVRGERGRARQLALGLEVTQGDVALFLHADTRLPSGWRDAVAAALADPAVVGGAFAFRFERVAGARLTPALALVEAGARLRTTLFGLPYGDQALFARRAILRAIGGVPQVPIMEDLDLVAALRRRGPFARLRLPALTSARRYRAGGPLRTMLRNWGAAAAWLAGVDRARVAAWYRRRSGEGSAPLRSGAAGSR